MLSEKPLYNEHLNWFPRCARPNYIRKYNIFVPCGKCFLCVESTKKMYAWRCIAESKCHCFNYFITLTFDDNHLNDTSYNIFQNFYKDICNYFGSSNFKFFLAYENGEKHYRPHFHLILFSDIDLIKFWDKNCKRLKNGIQIETLNEFFARMFWRKGFVSIKVADEKNIRYCCGYVLKKIEGYDLTSTAKKWSKSTESNKLFMFRTPYYRMSRGLGFDFYDANFNIILEKGYIPYGQYKMPIPRSWFSSRNFSCDHIGAEDKINVNQCKIGYNALDKAKRSIYEIQKKIKEVPF